MSRARQHLHAAVSEPRGARVVILSRGHAAEALACRWAMTHLGLSMRPRRVSARHRATPLRLSTGQTYLAATPSRRVCRAVRAQRVIRGAGEGIVSTARYAADLLPLRSRATAGERSTTTSTAACVAFFGDGIRSRRAGPGVSRPTQVFGPLGVYRMRPRRSALSRVPRRETSRRAGCGKSARPVRERRRDTAPWGGLRHRRSAKAAGNSDSSRLSRDRARLRSTPPCEERPNAASLGMDRRPEM